MLTTLAGTPYAFELVPANTDERDAADEILETLPPDSNAWSDKGFIGEEWQAAWSRQGGRVWTTKRENQKVQNPLEFDRLLNRVRERIEGAFDILKEGGRLVEHTLAHTVGGLYANYRQDCQCDLPPILPPILQHRRLDLHGQHVTFHIKRMILRKSPRFRRSP